jgi:[ribosomal protein S18]-alanine N-acetyltransferase
MVAADVDAVAELEALAFSTPWRADTFRTLLERPGAELLVVEADGELAGYAVLWCIMDQGELANIAIREADRGRGLGGILLDHVLQVARERGVRSLFLEVRVSNDAAAALYASRGFREIGRRRDYYERPREDARVLEKRL